VTKHSSFTHWQSHGYWRQWMAKLQMAMLMASEISRISCNRRHINLLDGRASFKDRKTWSNVVVYSMMRGWRLTSELLWPNR